MNNSPGYTQPEIKSAEDLFLQLAGSISNTVGFGTASGQMVANLARRYIPRLHGDDIAWNSPLISQQSTYGIYRDAARKREDRVADSAMRSALESGKERFVSDLLKNTFSEDYFKRQEGWTQSEKNEAAGLSYDQWISMKASSAARNPFVSALYSHMDPRGYGQAGVAMRDVFHNIVQNGGGSTGNMQIYGAARDVIKDLFRDKNGDFNYNKSEYGGFSMDATAGIAKALTETSNVLEGANTSSSSELRGAAQKLQNKIQEYAKALEPLRDVFGNDMGKIMSSISQVTGRSMADMSAGHVAQIAGRMSQGLLNGTISSTDELSARIGMHRDMLANMRVAPMQELFAAHQTMTTLEMSRGRFHNARVSREFAASTAMGKVLDSQNSPMEDFLAQTYSIWKQEQLAAGVKQDTSFQAFTGKIDQLRDKGMALDAAAMKVAGIHNRYQAGRGKYYAGYWEAKESQESADYVLNASIERDLNIAARRIGRSTTFRSSLKSDTVGYDDAWTMSNGDMTKNIKRMQKLMAARPELMSMDSASRSQALIDIMAKGGSFTYMENGEEKTMDLKTIFGGNTKAISTAMEGFINMNPKAVTLIAEKANKEKAAAERRDADTLRTTLNKLGVSYANNEKELADMVLTGGAGGKKHVKDRIAARKADTKAREEYVQKEINRVKAEFIAENGDANGELDAKRNSQLQRLIEKTRKNASSDYDKMVKNEETNRWKGGLSMENMYEVLSRGNVVGADLSTPGAKRAVALRDSIARNQAANIERRLGDKEAKDKFLEQRRKEIELDVRSRNGWGSRDLTRKEKREVNAEIKRQLGSRGEKDTSYREYVLEDEKKKAQGLMEYMTLNPEAYNSEYARLTMDQMVKNDRSQDTARQDKMLLDKLKAAKYDMSKLSENDRQYAKSRGFVDNNESNLNMAKVLGGDVYARVERAKGDLSKLDEATRKEALSLGFTNDAKANLERAATQRKQRAEDNGRVEKLLADNGYDITKLNAKDRGIAERMGYTKNAEANKKRADYKITTHGDLAFMQRVLDVGGDLSKLGAMDRERAKNLSMQEGDSQHNRAFAKNALQGWMSGLSEQDRNDYLFTLKEIERVGGDVNRLEGTYRTRALEMGFTGDKSKNMRLAEKIERNVRKSNFDAGGKQDQNMNTKLVSRLKALSAVSADMVEEYVKTGNLRDKETPLDKNDQDAVARNALRDAGGNLSQISNVEIKKRLRKLGYKEGGTAEERKRNLELAQVDKLGSIYERSGQTGVQNEIMRKRMDAAIGKLDNKDQQNKVKSLMNDLQVYANKQGLEMSDASTMNRFLRSKEGQKYLGDKNAAVRNQATRIFNEAGKGMTPESAGTQTDMLRSVDVIKDAVQEILNEVSGRNRENHTRRNRG